MTRYRIDTRRFTLKLLRGELSLPKALFAWLLTRLPLKWPASTDLPSVDALTPHLVHKSQMPPDVLEEIRQQTADIRALGFVGSLFHEIEDSEQQTTHHFATLLHTSGDTIARVKRRVFHATSPHKKFIRVEFISRRNDGIFLVTTNCRDDGEELPAFCQSHSMPKASISELWNEHRGRLSAPEWLGKTQLITSAQATAGVLERLHHQSVDYLVSRRIFVPVEEASDAPVRSTNGDALLPPETRQLVNEVRRQSEKKTTSPVNALLLLLVSMGLFVALGGAAWSWTFALFLVPILLFHELGHFLCMKMFDYRNVNMFFIPLFGAAVSGHHYNVPGWKRVVTSLMGPVPGIFVGLGLGIVALVRGGELLLQGSIIMVIINGFNLIPALPLDGGWVVHGLLFSRHAFLDLIFRIGAIALLFFIAAVGGGWILGAIGGAMLVGLPTAFHVARITDRLRAVERFPGVTDEAEIPPEAIVRISQELDQAFPKGIALKNKAKLTSQIFQNINSPAPGPLGTLALGAVYMGSLLTAVIGTFVLVLGQQADLGRLIAQGAFGPQQTVDPAQVIRQPVNLEPKEFDAPESLVASFANRAAAEQSLTNLKGTLAPDRKIVLFGSTIVLPLEATDSADDRGKWFDMLEAQAKPRAANAIALGNGPVFVANEKRRGMLRITCIAPSAEVAKRIEKAIAGYCWSKQSLHLVPPWDPQFQLEPPQQKARDTVAKLKENSWLADADDDSSVYEQISDAQRRGRDDLVEKLTDQLKSRQRERQREYVRKLHDSPDQYDDEVINAYEKAIAELPANTTPTDEEEEFGGVIAPVTDDWLGDLAPRLGQYPDGSPHPTALQTSYGGVERNGLMLDIYLSFESLPSGMLALLDWLSQQGCSTFKYSL